MVNIIEQKDGKSILVECVNEKRFNLLKKFLDLFHETLVELD